MPDGVCGGDISVLCCPSKPHELLWLVFSTTLGNSVVGLLYCILYIIIERGFLRFYVVSRNLDNCLADFRVVFINCSNN